MSVLKSIFSWVGNLKLATKFVGAITIILFVTTLLDVSYNANKSKTITHEAVKEWTILFAENVRVSLNTLMREGRMDMRFAIFDSMKDELKGLRDVRVIRGERTNEVFMEVNRRDVIPQLTESKQGFEARISEHNQALQTVQDEDERDEILELIDELQMNIEEIDEKLREASMAIKTDSREMARDALDQKVLDEGENIFLFEGDNARVLIPYTTKRESCSNEDGCHKYANEGDVLGAISLEFSMHAINEQIKENNVKMIGIWVIRFVVFLSVIIFLLSFIITGNLHKMLRIFSKMSKGDFSVRAPMTSGDEIGQLALGFNSMASSLEEMRAELDKRLLEIYALYNVSKTLNASFETEQLLIKLVKDISKNMDIDRMMIMLPDKNFNKLNVASYTGFSEAEIHDVTPSLHEGIYAQIMSTGISRLIENVDDDYTISVRDVFSPDVGSLVAVPFLRRGKVLGLICAFRDRPKQFQFSDLKLFNNVAEHLAIAMENARLFEQTKKMAITDGLTGIYNKRFYTKTIEKEIVRSQRCDHDLSLLIMDIDNFKHYNDTNGHPAGDTLLKELAELIKETVRVTDIVCRYGGEEFIVILPETSKEDAAVVAEKIVSKVNQHPFAYAENQPLGCISVSMGLATFPADGDDEVSLLENADSALYQAKTSGKNQVKLYHP